MTTQRYSSFRTLSRFISQSTGELLDRLSGWRGLSFAIVASIGASGFLSAAVLPTVDSIVTETQKLVDSSGEALDHFGRSVDVSGQYMIAGSPYDDDLGEYSGSATVYELQGGAWVEVARLRASDSVANDRFGTSVSLDGDRAVVGAPGHAPLNPAIRAGAAYVFQRQADGQWLQTGKLIASDGTSATDFATSVAVSGDAAIVGAPYAKTAYVFEKGGDGVWVEVARLFMDRIKFGYSVAIDGGRLVIGQLLEGSYAAPASAYIYERQSDGSWLHTAEITPPWGFFVPPVFGRSVAISEGRIIAGSNALQAYLFERQIDGVWTHVQSFTPPAGFDQNYNFGRAVDLSGERVVVGSGYSVTGIAEAHVFVRQPDDRWVYQLGLAQSDQENNGFGKTVAISGDTVISGAEFSDSRGTSSGAAYVFQLPTMPVTGVELRDIGALPNAGESSRATDASQDGGVVVGDIFSSGRHRAFYWTETAGLTVLGPLPSGYTESPGNAVSSDGTTVVGQLSVYGGDAEPYRWNTVEGLIPLGGFAGAALNGSANDVSADGAVIVGHAVSAQGRQEAFRWTKRQGMVSLATDLGAVNDSVAYGVSADGTVVVGQSDNRAFRWMQPGEVDWLGALPSHVYSVATAVSANGRIVVGESWADATPSEKEAFLWTPEGGMVSLGSLSTPSYSAALGVPDDGALVLGNDGASFPVAPFVWDATHGMRHLQDIVVSNYGIDLKGGVLWWFGATSGDGNTLVGVYGTNGSIGGGHAFVLTFTGAQPANNLPQLTVHSPLDGSSFNAEQYIPLDAVATDNEDGDLSGQIEWRSSIDGVIGHGAPGQSLITLSPGVHEITATVWDSGGGTTFVRSTITTITGGANTPPFAYLSGPSMAHWGELLTFDGSASYDLDGDPIISYRWDFGDGTTSTGPVVEHTYSTPGNYTVTLIVSDETADSAPATLLIDVTNAAPIAYINGPPTVHWRQSIWFDATMSTDPDWDPIVSYRWDLGDGTTSTEPMVGHRYAAPGSYTVTLVVSDGITESAPATLTVEVTNTAPVADFYQPPPTHWGHSIVFDALMSTDPDWDPIVSYHWDFGDGTTSTEPMVEHTYAAPGSYTVTLVVSDAFADSAPVTRTVEVTNSAPVADFYQPLPTHWGHSVRFDGSLSSDPDWDPIVSSRWDFGDGTTSTEPVVDHVYSTPGSYTVTLVVSDAFADSAPVARTVEVTNSAPVADFYQPPPTHWGQPVRFDSSLSSDPDWDPIVSARWDFGDGTTSTEPVVEHTYAAPGSYTVTLIISDAFADSAPVTRTVEVTNETPVAGLSGPTTGFRGQPLTLNAGSSVDPNGDALTYYWDFGDGSTATTPTPTVSHTYEMLGNYTVGLYVSDGFAQSAPISTVVAILNNPPVADAGATQTVNDRATVYLNGQGSYDPDGTIASFSWIQVSGKKVKLKNATGATPEFNVNNIPSGTTDVASFELTVTDNDGGTASNQVVIYMQSMD